MRILQIKNKGVGELPYSDYKTWLEQFGYVEIDQMNLDIPVSYKDFGVWNGVTLRGLDEIKEQLRAYVPQGYDIVQFFYYPNKEKNLANWTYPNDLNGASFCEFPYPQSNLLEVLQHETIHALYRLLNRKGIFIYERGLDDKDLIKNNLDILLGYKDKINPTPLNSLLNGLISLLSLFKSRLEKRLKLYQTALSLVGEDISPTQNELGCAESINTVHKIAFGDEIGGGVSTALMFQSLLRRKDFEPCGYETGAIIITPAEGKKYGHVGVCGKDFILSNNSKTYLFDKHLTEEKWEILFKGRPIYYFRKI